MGLGKQLDWLRIAIFALLALFASTAALLIFISEKRPLLLDITTLSLAILGIVFAVIQYFHSQHMLAEIPTRFVGDFPDCVGDVADVVALATRTLDVMNDRCAYGQFSNQRDFQRYFGKSLEKLAHQVAVRMIVYDKTFQHIDRDKQFGADWEKIKSSKNFDDFYANERAPTTFTEFKANLADKETARQKAMKDAGVDLRVISHDMLAFVWIADGKEAAFSFRIRDRGLSREVAFRTRDPNLVKTLSRVFQRTWDYESRDWKSIPA